MNRKGETMKIFKGLLVGLLLAVIFVGQAVAATPGTCTQKLDKYSVTGMRVLTFTCTAGDAGAYPSTATSAAITTDIAGYYLTEVRTNPGTTGPQAAYDIVLNDANGIDLMGGTLADRSNSASEAAPPAIATGVYWPRLIAGALTLVITNNNVASAVTVITVLLAR